MNSSAHLWRRARTIGLVVGLIFASGVLCAAVGYWVYWASAADLLPVQPPPDDPTGAVSPQAAWSPAERATAISSNSPIASASAPAPAVDVIPQEIPRLEPGTVVADRAPAGWTHLVIKSKPRIADASRADVSDTVAQLATLVSSIIVADVRAVQSPAGRTFRLARFAVGLATAVEGQDKVVTSDSYERIGAKFGFLEASVLAAAEEQLAKMRQLVRSPTMALLQGEGVLWLDGKHQVVLVRYALLVDPRSGRLYALCWGLQPRENGRYGLVGSTVRWLPPGLIEDCQLHVDPDQFFLGVPSRTAFAMAQLPPGRKLLRASRRLAELLVRPTYLPAEARLLETHLWRALATMAGRQ